MVIGKDKQRLNKLEKEVKELADKFNSLCELIVLVKEHDTKLKELSIVVDNIQDGDVDIKSPQQLLKEWFEGDSK